MMKNVFTNQIKFFFILIFGFLALLCSAPINTSSRFQIIQNFKIDSLSNQIGILSNRAEEFYSLGQYDSAAFYFTKVAQNAGRNISGEEIFFKTAYSYYKIDSLDKALSFFKQLLIENPDYIVRDYVEYFISQILIRQNNFALAEKLLEKVLQSTKSPYLQSLASWSLARIVRDPEKQLHFLNRVKWKFIPDSVETYVQLKLAVLKERHPENYKKYLVKIIGKDFRKEFEDYLFSQIDSIADQFSEKEKIKLLKIFSQKYNHRYFDEWYLRLSNETKGSNSFRTKIDLIRALFLYKNRKYTSAFRLLKQLNNKYLGREEQAEKYLHIARCNARLGFTNDAIRAYYYFQRKYPHHKLAPDALWWIALTYEQRKDFKNARKFLELLAKKYRREGTEARFRLIFMDILNGNYTSALKELQRIEKRVDYNNYIRSVFWQRYLNYQLGNLSEVDQLTDILLKDPFQNIYTLKVFLNVKKDSLRMILNTLPPNQINYTTLSREFRQKIDRVLIVENLLGQKFAKYEIQVIRKIPYSHEREVVFLANLNEKLGNFGIAYALLRDLYYARYLKKNWNGKLHMIKRLYPLYYDELVEKYCEKFNVDPLLVFGLMKRESMFQHDVKSYANAFGLLQLLPSTAKRLQKYVPAVPYNDPIDLFNPEINIPLGIYYIHKLLKDFNHHYPSVIASYNAGEHRVKRWRERYKTDNDLLFIELMPIEQTRKYVKFVLYYYYGYQLFYRPDGEVSLNIQVR